MDRTDTLIRLPEELFEVSESSSFSGVWECPELRVGPDTYRFAEGLPWNVLVVNTGEGALMLTGTVSGMARVACARCLEEFDIDFEGEIEGSVFLKVPSADEVDDFDDDDYVVVDEEKRIDIEHFLRAALVLDAPYVPLHDDDCKGLCPNCGADLNDGPCACADDAAEADEFSTKKNPFAALADYKCE